jgi:hypothetical protein
MLVLYYTVPFCSVISVLKIIELQKQMNEIQIEASKGKDETASEISGLSILSHVPLMYDH